MTSELQRLQLQLRPGPLIAPNVVSQLTDWPPRFSQCSGAVMDCQLSSCHQDTDGKMDMLKGLSSNQRSLEKDRKTL